MIIKKQALFQCERVSTNHLKQPSITKEFAGLEPFQIQVERYLSASEMEVLVTASSEIMDMILASYTPLGDVLEWEEEEPEEEESDE